MRLKLRNCKNQGDAAQEYVILEATDDCNLSRFAIYDATYERGGRLSNKMRHFFRFPDHEVKRGDLISLRTGKGNDVVGRDQLGRTVHRFQWGLGAAVWNDSGDAAVLIEITGTEAIKAC